MKISLKILSAIFLFLVLSLSCGKDKERTEPAEEPKAIAKFSFTPNEATAPATIQFANESQNADSYLWDFGDGATSTEKNPSHVYEGEGDFAVTLKASSKSSDDDYSQMVIVLPAPNLLLGKWVLTTGTHNNTPIANLEATINFKSETRYSASFEVNTNRGSVTADYNLEQDTQFKSNLPENMLINGSSFSHNGNGSFIWQASISSSSSAFLNYGGTALGWSRTNDHISLEVAENKLTLQSKDGKTVLTYQKE